MTILSIATRGASLFGKSAAITAGVLVGTLAVGKGLQFAGRVQSHRDGGKTLKDAIKTAFGENEPFINFGKDPVQPAAPTAEAPSKPAPDFTNFATKDVYTGHVSDPMPVVTDDQLLDLQAALQQAPQLLGLASIYGFMGDEQDIKLQLSFLWAEDAKDRTIVELRDWARNLHSETTVNCMIANYGDIAFDKAVAAGYNGTSDQLFAVMRLWVVDMLNANKNAAVTNTDVYAWAAKLGERDKQQDEYNKAQRELDERNQIEQEVRKQDEVAERKEVDTAASKPEVIATVTNEDGSKGVTASTLPTKPVDPAAPKAEILTGEAMTAALDTASAAAQNTVTDADKAKAAKTIADAAQAADAKNAAKARRTSAQGTSSKKPGDTK